MRFAGLKNIFGIRLQLQLDAWWGDVIMTLKYTVEGEDERKKNIWDRKMNKREDSMIYDHLVVFIRHDPVEIRRFRCQHTLGLGTLKNLASTGIFGLVVCALNCATKRDPSEPSMILAHRKDIKSRSPKKWGPSRKFHRARQRANTPSGGRDKMYE